MNKHPTMPAAEAFRLLGMNNKMSVIDVRSQGEYEKAHFENTLNIPILSDSHRHDVGLTYKIEGSEAAKALGHKLVSGDYKEELIQPMVRVDQKPSSRTGFNFLLARRAAISIGSRLGVPKWLRSYSC